MISKNSNWSGKNEPFLLKPAGKDYLWGGTRLKDDFSKEFDLNPLAETWECSTHPDGMSVAASGAFKGQTLSQIVNEHPELLGTHPRSIFGDGGLPIIMKLIDAKEDLSVQVHPDDAYAAQHENGQHGKTEMWYVVDAAKGASLVYGFQHDMDRDAVRRAVENGTISRYLQRVPIQKGDVFYIPAGQVHAIGAGALVAEVQESSNLTYRLFDYNRVDASGKPRALHVEKALEVANLRGSASPRQPMRTLHFQRGQASELLCRCRYFQVERVLINTERVHDLAAMQTQSNSFQALLCVSGCGMIFWEGNALPLFKGDCVFIPADSISIKIHGKLQLLRVGC